jgi:hypothetical protein
MSEHHTFDVDGDLLLILSRPVPKEGNDNHSLESHVAEDPLLGAHTGLLATPTLDESIGHRDITAEITVIMVVSSKQMMLASPVL